ncbi:MAG: Pycsar system effector family protein [Bacteroidota bacterium]|mgnify:CR=1 FL=1|uniref:Metal-dependent phosphohydrolase, HD subdomain n=1 Tax=Christiangramia flava JLT2011 TaxID=1229726 RepID=A0A1L7HZR9_9FLAO|nr:Pycsar system effector family protein [Christiangramia flava]APU66838.1 Metal-dependent phosphohydrolase, HD subdomain [Christiangramia flava JLT2011]MEE2773025.1 Pycsar system effector family protein [Bacteroidota bacterium]OSS38475.1 Metal-dependent phosphohydrolase [Christiangramia flava JLT2011]
MNNLVEKADKFVEELFKEKLPNTFIYHNYQHTQRVVKSTKELIDKSEINVKDEEALMVAAWMHDTGYTKTYAGHEEESAKIAESFLKENNATQELIDRVKELILATNFSYQPKDQGEEIIRDADSSHFGKDYFGETSELLRQELELHRIKTYTATEWLNENIKVLTEKHQFYTDYAIKEWEPKKQENLLELIEAKNKQEKKLKKEEHKARMKAKYKNDNPERSIQTLYRTTLRNHIKLSDIADTKANILLSVNAIIISLAIADMIPKLEAASNKHLIIPTLVLILFSVASMILSIMSTRPNVTSGEFTKDQVKKREVNLLFFGNYHKMPFGQFKWAMDELMKDKDYVYEMLTLDLHSLGKVLHRKYMLLRLTYTVFMTGIVISVLSYIVSFYLM